MSSRKAVQRVRLVVLDKFRNLPNVIGIFIIGSAVQGKFDQFSDVDFYVITKKQPKKDRENFTYLGVDIEILQDTTQGVRSYIKNETGIYKNVSHMLANGKIIHGKSKQLIQIHDMAKKNLKKPSKVSAHEIAMHLYSLKDFLGDAERDVFNSDAIAFYLDSSKFIQNAIELIFKRNKTYLRKSREMADELTRLHPKFARLLKEFNKAYEIADKFEILQKMQKVLA